MSLNGYYFSMETCLFCRIIANSLPAYKVLETEAVVAFLDIFPVHPGHILVVPKCHAEQITDLSAALLGGVLQEIPKIAKALVEVTGCEGYTLLQNNGAAAGQVIPHVHFHVIPRWSSDGLRHWPSQTLAPSEGERLAEQMRQFTQ